MLPQARLANQFARETSALTILGSTGSIGTQALEIVALHPERLKVRALTAGSNVALLAEQVHRFRPELAVIADDSALGDLRDAVSGSGCKVAAGAQALCEAAALDDVDVVMTALVGYAGLEPTLAAVRRGRRIALANKETLVVAGHLMSSRVQASGAEVIPVDSEHSAIFQCLLGEPTSEIDKLILTASGGPFRDRRGSFDSITPEEALDHPNWDMGAKITIDSATLMNKGLEVIEARWMFDIPPDRLHVVVHPQSIIHSMVEFSDGSTKAQLGVPDMKVPIQYALSFPARWPAPHERVDWSRLGALTFSAPDLERFPCLGLAFEALRRGGTAPAVLNAANEVAVAHFLAGKLPFTGIPDLIARTLDTVSGPGDTLDALRSADAEARRKAEELAPALTD